MKTQSNFKKYMALISLGFMGGTIYMPSYIGSTFYTQLLDSLAMTNTEYGIVSSINSIFYLIIAIPGAFLADRWEAKKTIIMSIGGVALLSLTFPLWVKGFVTYAIFKVGLSIVKIAYWGCLIKYINNLGGEDEAGNSFGTYYLINGLSGAVGSFVPLWAGSMFNNNIGVILFVEGIVLALATVLVWIFLEDEKTLAGRGVYLKGDEPIQLKHIVHVLKWPGTYMLFFGYMTTIALYDYMSYLNPYLTNVYGMNENLSSALAIVRQYGSNFFAPIGGYMADKVLKKTWKWYIMGFAINGLLYLGLAVFFGSASNVVVAGIYTCVISCMSMALYTVTFSILRELHVPNMVSATVVGISSMSGSISGMILPPMFGFFLDNYSGATGYNYIFITLTAMCAFGIVNALWVASHDKKCLAGKRVFDISKIEG